MTDEPDTKAAHRAPSRRRDLPQVDHVLLRRSIRLAKPRPKPPPKRTRRQRIMAWLRRGKLWDDIFTRTFSGILTVSIIAVFAAAFGVIHFSPQGWATVVATILGGAWWIFIVVTGPYFEKRWRRWNPEIVGLISGVAVVLVWMVLFLVVLQIH